MTEKLLESFKFDLKCETLTDRCMKIIKQNLYFSST